MKKTKDLRQILSQNIRNVRGLLHISQAKLAESAGLSVSHIVDIEYCKTWVSDKTLNSIARALNLEAYELLIPEKEGQNTAESKALKRIADIVKTKKTLLRQKTGEIIDDLMLEITRNYKE
ncbi:MAG: helix-turn-helix domain-containing protein [Treponema sp.]|jgi:transcriptional regulator with XRE-family HTH domain|nr:helix-turn-helix domain-containing protein [Treponema sp.]